VSDPIIHCTPGEQHRQVDGDQVLRSAERLALIVFFVPEPALLGKGKKDSRCIPAETRDTILAVSRERGDAWAGAVHNLYHRSI
jgi:hypothetical protein